MNIITIPHPTLRQKAKSITKLDNKIGKFVKNLEKTLDEKRNPAGVGLAAPQVDKLYRVFATKLSPEQSRPSNQPPLLRHFINPHITQKSHQLTLGANPKKPDLEGCLSMPGLYGPVPRWEWVEIEWQEIVGDELQTNSSRFEDFHARVMQHELDHLDGVLFTDYSLEYDLPVYKEDEAGELAELDRRLVEVI